MYWPAFLMAAGLDPPKKVFCHSHWLVDGVKVRLYEHFCGHHENMPIQIY